MFMRFVTSNTVTSRRSGSASSLLSLIAAGSLAFSRCAKRTRLTDRMPASIPEKMKETSRQRRTAIQTISSLGLLALFLWLKQHLLHAFARDAAHGEDEALELQRGAGFGQCADAVEDEAAYGVDPLLRQFGVEQFVDIVEPRVAVDDQAAVADRLDVELLLGLRDGVGNDLLNDVRQRDDALS